LLATRLIGRIRAAMNVELPVRALFEAPTVALLAQRIDAGQAAPTAQPALRCMPRPAAIPLSFAQQRLWFLHRLEGAGESYCIASCWRLHGSIDADALQAALADLVGRHESLRTVFPEMADGPCQLVVDEELIEPGLERRHLGDAADPEASLQDALRDAVRFRFDLATQVPLRATLFSLGHNEHVLLLLLHHIAADGESMAPLMADLALAYASRCQGRAPNWTPLAIQYADYTLWQRAMLAEPSDPTSRAGRQLAYWRDTLAGAPELCSIAPDRARPAISSHRNATVALDISPALHAKLLATGQRYGASLFMVLHAALAILLSRLGAGRDVVVGSPIAGRTDAALEPLVGFFVNTIALRTDVSDNPDIATLLLTVRERCLAAYANQDLPFEQVIEALNPVRTLSAHPLFQVMLGLQNAGQQPDLELPDLHVEHLPMHLPIVKCDVVFNLRESIDERNVPNGLHGHIEYAEDLFDAPTIERLARQWGRVLEAIVAMPQRRLEDIDLLDDEDQQLLQRWNATAQPIPDLSVPALFEQRVSLHPNELAIVSREQRLTYAQLNARANQLAHRLLALGVRTEDRIAVQLDDPLDFTVAVLAVLKAGAAYAPLSSRYPDERKQWIMADARAEVLLIKGEVPGTVVNACIRVVDIDDPALAREPAANPALSVPADRLAYVMYTSGSTGRPKGVAVTHANIVSLAADRRWLGGEHARVLAHSPHAFDASTYELWVPLLTGQQVIAAPLGDLEPCTLRQSIDEAGVTAVFLTTAMFRLAMEADPHCLRGLRTLWTGGERASGAAFERMRASCPHTAVVHVYGPTETTTFAIAHRIPPAANVAENVPLGVPLDNTQIHLLDADSIERQRFGEQGGKRLLGGRAWGACVGARSELRRGQCPSIDLAVGRERQRVEDDECGGHHVVGQSLGQIAAQGGRCWLRVVGRNDISDQLAVAGLVFACDDGGLGDMRVLLECSLDFAGFDAKAADLDLLVDAAEELERAVVAPAAQVAGAIEPSAGRAERIRDETFGREGRPIQVAARHARTTDADFARRPDRYRLEVGIEQMDLRVVDGLADGQIMHARHGGCHRGEHSGLGRTVGVDHVMAAMPALDEGGRDGLTGDDQIAHAGQAPFGHDGEHGRRQGDVGDAFERDQGGQGGAGHEVIGGGHDRGRTGK
jgi:non-ribosomal peptide synthetase component F